MPMGWKPWTVNVWPRKVIEKYIFVSNRTPFVYVIKDEFWLEAASSVGLLQAKNNNPERHTRIEYFFMADNFFIKINQKYCVAIYIEISKAFLFPGSYTTLLMVNLMCPDRYKKPSENRRASIWLLNFLLSYVFVG